MVKQVIAVRTDLKMRKGKIAAQVAHASMGVLLKNKEALGYYVGNDLSVEYLVTHYKISVIDNKWMTEWLEGKFTKVVVKVSSEEELLELCDKAQKRKIPHCLITDAGDTVFNGVPTKTCAAFGPYDPDAINKLTGELKLL